VLHGYANPRRIDGKDRVTRSNQATAARGITPSPSTTAGARSPRRPSTSSSGPHPRATDLEALSAPRQL